MNIDMNPVLLYLLKANVAISGMYLFYLTVLRRTTFHSSNRLYFLVCLVLAALLPVINLSHFFPQVPPAIFTTKLVDPNIKVSGDTGWHAEDCVLATMCAGSLLLLVRFLVQCIGLYRVYRRSNKLQFKHHRLVLLNDPASPFSFFSWIFIHPDSHSARDLDEIVQHELVHVRQKHTIDILAYSCALIACWYNPLLWLMRNSMRQNLEYQTDKQLLDSGTNRRNYQFHLLKLSHAPSYAGITNNFNFYYHNLKDRIMMMNKKQSARIGLLRYALLIPVFAGMTLMLNAQDKLKPQKQESSKEAKGAVAAEKATEEAAPASSIAFDKLTHDFGTIKEENGEVTALFTFVNKGKTPLVISSVQASCGCTTPEWTKEPVAPGESGHIKAIYGAKGRVYPFDKTITVHSNAEPSSVVLHIKGNVVK